MRTSGSVLRKRARLTAEKSRSPSSSSTAAIPGLQGGFQFVEFFADLGEHSGLIGPVEADFRGFFLKFRRTQQGGQSFADAVEIGLLLIAFFRAFDFVPLLEDGLGSGGIALGEDMRVAAHEFVADAAGDIVEIETAGFLGEFAVENDLQQQVPSSSLRWL